MELYSTPFQLNKICAFIDVQGFSLEKNSSSSLHFIPRELSVYGENGSVHLAYNTTLLESELTSKQLTTAHYLTKNIHGLPLQFESDSDPRLFSTFIEDIKKLYELFRTDSKQFFGVKNHHLASYLKQLNIKFVDFAPVYKNVPTTTDLDALYNTNDVCQLHAKKLNGRNFMCSRRKARNFYKWILENAVVDGYMNIF